MFDVHVVLLGWMYSSLIRDVFSAAVAHVGIMCHIGKCLASINVFTGEKNDK